MSIERLTEILLDKDRKRLASLEAELGKLRTTIEDRESLIKSLTPVVGDLLERKIASSGEEMAEIVAPLMGPAIKKQVSESRDEVVEALYPVIGQTVRRAVAEAMRKLVKQINARLDRAFQLQSIWPRLKARILGLPAPLAVIPQVFPFTVEQLFLIDQKTGLLMLHESSVRQANDGKPQMISGMLTAIQDFTKDAFGSEAEGDLHEVKYGDRLIFIISTPLAFLAAVTVGSPPLQFPERLRSLLRRLHNTFHAQLHSFNGDTQFLEDAREPMRKFMASFAESPDRAAKIDSGGIAGSPRSTFTKVALGIGIGILLSGAAWFLFGPSDQPATEQIATDVQPASITPGAGRFRLEARVSGEVWMRAVTDERDSTDFRFLAGEVYAWRADRIIRLRVGNAGQTELFVDGKNLGPLGDVHQPVTLLITGEGIVHNGSVQDLQ